MRQRNPQRQHRNTCLVQRVMQNPHQTRRALIRRATQPQTLSQIFISRTANNPERTGVGRHAHHGTQSSHCFRLGALRHFSQGRRKSTPTQMRLYPRHHHQISLALRSMHRKHLVRRPRQHPFTVIVKRHHRAFLSEIKKSFRVDIAQPSGVKVLRQPVNGRRSSPRSIKQSLKSHRQHWAI